jgi:hypothetical protein
MLVAETNDRTGQKDDLLLLLRAGTCVATSAARALGLRVRRKHQVARRHGQPGRGGGSIESQIAAGEKIMFLLLPGRLPRGRP